MAKEKDVKLITVQKLNPELYEQVLIGKMSVNDAYNEVKRQQLGLTEFRGTNTSKKDFATDFKRIVKLHGVSLEEVIGEVKKNFPYTWKDFLKP
ncbi:hypothetical protein [Pedobacter jejuensis]|uniref:Uncharacterized protein n=1 Tax=Pedobacter jejuensis TaxID=1268550 RepID=A0A3N0BUX3_9SPHI|nr:hypothetical protein [Pedobacter jejuensis]RNL53142.1 hypothetical protein D7004_10575 [Pedobacter jejuensis]